MPKNVSKEWGKRFLWLLISSVVLVWIFSLIDFTEQFLQFSREHENWELDEIIAGICVFCFGMLWLAYRAVIELKTTQVTLLEKNQQLLQLTNVITQMNESVLITDRSGVIEYVNPAFTKVTGYLEAEVLGKDPSILKSSAQDPTYYKELWDTISNGKVWQGVLVDRKKDGSFYPTEMTISPLLDDKGCITHYVAFQQDITEKRALEEHFQQSQKMDAIGTLVGGMAHDFNNTLAGITANTYLAKMKSSGSPDVTERLETIERLSFGASEMIKTLLTFARKETVSMCSFEVGAFLKGVASNHKLLVPPDIKFNYESSMENGFIKGDASLLQQVIINLVNNACDASKGVNKSSYVNLSLDEYRADKEFLNKHDITGENFTHISVADNGTGIDPETIKYIFDPYFTTKEQGKGTGLGLAMAYGTIKSHGGAIDVESVLAKGTVFHIYLPIITSVDDVNASEEKVVVSGNKETILYADDDAEVLESTAEVFRGLNYNVLTASNGREGLELYQKNMNEISLIILDVVMPEMGGVDTSKAIKEINPNAKIVFVSGYDMYGELADGNTSSEPVIRKPFTISEISGVIQANLRM